MTYLETFFLQKVDVSRIFIQIILIPIDQQNAIVSEIYCP